MDISNPASPLGINLLDRSNYKYWRTCMESYLVGEDLWDVVAGNDIISSDDLKKWKQRNAKAEFALKISISHSVLDDITGCKSAHEIWQTLDRLFNQVDEITTIREVKVDAKDRPKHHLRLHKAALEGDWKTAKGIFDEFPTALSARITSCGETALHVAVDAGRAKFVEKLVEHMPSDDLKIKEHEFGCTALHYAAMYGSLPIVETLVKKNGELAQILDREQLSPLHAAVYQNKSKKVVKYLILKMYDYHGELTANHVYTSPYLADGRGGDLIIRLVASRFYDVCFDLMKRCPVLTRATSGDGHEMLHLLALQPSDFRSGSELGFWGRSIYQLVPMESDHHKARHSVPKGDVENPERREPLTSLQLVTLHLNQGTRWIYRASWKTIAYLVPGIKHIKDMKFKHQCTQKMVEIACGQLSSLNETKIRNHFNEHQILPLAAEHGIVELINTCLQHFPFLSGRGILEKAVLHRQVKVFNLFIGGTATMKDFASCYRPEKQEAILKKVARLAAYPRLSSVSCPALQMQRELQWFKAVENHVMGQKWKEPQEIFTNEHKDLLKDAERWMKDTANSCMVVSTLIATVVFAAAFTVPGGNVEGKGIPIFIGEEIFILFAASDALALFSSTTSILMFLSILTARFAEDDFLHTLPKRLILGFASLFLAIASMMVAFGATLYMVLNKRFGWIFILIMAVTSIPVALFVMLQLPLFIYMAQSTYGPGIFHPEKIW